MREKAKLEIQIAFNIVNSSIQQLTSTVRVISSFGRADTSRPALLATLMRPLERSIVNKLLGSPPTNEYSIFEVISGSFA